MTAKKLIPLAATAILLAIFVLFPAQVSNAVDSGNYTLLAPLPLGNNGETTATVPLGTDAFGNYLNNAFKLGITVAILLAVIMIVIGGVEYMGSDSIFAKDAGKDKIEKAIWGLVLALAIFLILNTVNPDLVKLKLTVEKLEQPPKTVTVPAVVPDTSSAFATECPDCANIPSSLNVKSGACTKLGQASNVCKLNAGLLNALLQIKNNPSTSDMNWQITEAWPQTIQHKSDCHGNGGCVDVNFSPTFWTGANATPANINTFCNAAKSAGLNPHYEVGTAAELSTLANAGVTCARTATVTAPHFHIEM